jgi:hypothetical protein
MERIMSFSKFISLCCIVILPLSAFPGDFDGSKPLHGSVDKIVEINQFKIKDNANPDSVGLPRNFLIDFKDNIIRPTEDSVVRKTSKIDRIEYIENKLILQGVEEGVENVDDGLAWSIVISIKTGKVVLSAVGDGVGYVVFGKCEVAQKIQR